MLFLWRGFTRSRRRDFIISGVLFGLSAYTYSATRMLPVVFIGFAIILAIFNRPFLRKHGLNFALTILTAALIVLPMAYPHRDRARRRAAPGRSGRPARRTGKRRRAAFDQFHARHGRHVHRHAAIRSGCITFPTGRFSIC